MWPPTIVGGHRLIAEGGKKDPYKVCALTLIEDTIINTDQNGFDFWLVFLGGSDTPVTPTLGAGNGDLIISNDYLTREQMKVNAQYIYDYLLAKGWTKNAICAMLGNMETESTINPGIWESRDEGNLKGGFGLVQWTPASKYLDWAEANGLDPNDMDSQLMRILYEVDTVNPNDIQWIPKGTKMTFKQFTQSTDSVKALAKIFLNSYERPRESDQPKRGEQARYWYNFFN